MTIPVPDDPDGEDVVMSILDSLAPSREATGTAIDPPEIQVRVTGGTSTRLEIRPIVEVAYFGKDYPEAKALAAEGERRILGSRGKNVELVDGVVGFPGTVLVDKTETIAVPLEISYQDAKLRRKTGRYRLVMRRRRAV